MLSGFIYPKNEKRIQPHLKGDDGTQRVDVWVCSDKPNRGKMEFGSKTCSEANPGQSTRLISVQSNTACFIRHRNNKLLVGSQPVPLGRLQVHADEQVIEAAPHWPRQVGVLYGIEELRFIHMAAQSVSHTVVSQSAHWAVQLQRVIVELQ